MILVTGNEGKLREFRSILGDSLESRAIDLDELQSLDPEVIIKHKLQQAFEIIKSTVIVEDTSLCIDALGGLPGTLIKWFESSLSLNKIVKMARSLQVEDELSATASTAVGWYDGKDIIFVTGITKGIIVEPKGENKFGWDPIFVPDGSNKTQAEMDITEKNIYSSRRKAVELLVEKLRD
jgi:non-canonical purine NTP pyrophosphatase (RdgB/HAM1 family)